MIKINEKQHSSDILVVGGGIAGLMSSISAAESGAKVVLMEKADASRSGDGVAGNDHFLCYIPELHGSKEAFNREWGMSGMGGMIDPANWNAFVDRSFECMQKWEDWGIDMRPSGKYECIGHAYPDRMRIWLKYDGRNQKEILRAQALKLGVQIVNKTTLVDYLLDETGSICGAIGLDTSKAEPSLTLFSCQALITCTGLANRLYPSITPAMHFNTAHCPANAGAGRAAAYRAGAELVNMEFPITWVGPKYLERCGKASWIGLLADPTGTPAGPFVEKPNKYLGDITADIWHNVFNEKRASGQGPIYMDCTKIDQEDMDYMMWAFQCEGIVSINDLMDEQGFTLREKMVEFTRYEPQCAGGIRVNEHGATNIPGLYACGDESGNGSQGISGAAVTGMIAGEHAAQTVKTAPKDKASNLESHELVVAQQQRLSAFLDRKNGAHWSELLKSTQQLMNDYAGIETPRYENLMQCGLDHLGELERAAEEKISCANSHELMRALEAFDLLQIGKVVCAAAMERKESRMMHRRIDNSYTNPLLNGKELVVKRDEPGFKFSWEERS